MPVYKYKCRECGKVHNHFQSSIGFYKQMKSVCCDKEVKQLITSPAPFDGDDRQYKGKH